MSFYFMGALLFVNVFWLVSRLKKKKSLSKVRVETASFNKEICTLWIILSVFSVTYILRGTWDLTIKASYNNFEKQLWAVLTGILFDFLPIILILVLHYKNFGEKRMSDNTENPSTYRGNSALRSTLISEETT